MASRNTKQQKEVKDEEDDDDEIKNIYDICGIPGLFKNILKFIFKGVFDITGVFVSVVNTLKPLVVVDAPLVYRRRNKFGIIAKVKENIQKKRVTFVVISFTIV